MNVLEKIAAQQGEKYTDIWMVGQQLKDILRADPSLGEIVDKDLDVKGMLLADCAKKIKAWADEQHKKQKGNCVCVPPDVAESIIREFYGLPERPSKQADGVAAAAISAPEEGFEDPFDFSTFL